MKFLKYGIVAGTNGDMLLMPLDNTENTIATVTGFKKLKKNVIYLEINISIIDNTESKP